MAFMRMYGYEGDPGPRPAPRRKQAAAGPRAKAKRKRQVRARREERGKRGASKAPGKGKLDIGAILRGQFGKAAGKTFEFGKKLAGRDLLGAATDFMARPGRQMAGGGGRKSMNVSNVKALRRALRRFEGFKKLVKRVDKMLPMGARLAGGGAARSRGHKRGCKCVACR